MCVGQTQGESVGEWDLEILRAVLGLFSLSLSLVLSVTDSGHRYGAECMSAVLRVEVVCGSLLCSESSYSSGEGLDVK